MSGIFTFCDDDAVHIFTDGAACDGDGVMTARRSKVRIIPEWPGALTIRGTPEFGCFLGMFWPSSGTDFDGALAELPDAAAHVLGILEQNARPYTGFEIVVAGWSVERQRFEVWDLYGGDRSGQAEADHPALTLRRLDGVTASWPAPPVEAVQAVWPGGEPTVTEIGRAFLCAIRATPYPNALNPAALYHAVGGFIQETVVEHRGCSTRLIHHWPDVIGERIDPEAEAA